MPAVTEHHCTLAPPEKFDSFGYGDSRVDKNEVGSYKNPTGKSYKVLYGFKKGGGSEVHSFRYAADTWTAEKARSHCIAHGGSFTAAEKTKTEIATEKLKNATR